MIYTPTQVEHNTPMKSGSDNEEEHISKSQRKRDMHALQELGEELTRMPINALKKLDLPENLLTEILAAHETPSHGAHKRQLQLIGKLMRHIDAEPIKFALDQAKRQSSSTTKYFHMLEDWRDRLVNEGDDALSDLLAQFPDADRQQLRQLTRNAKKEKERNSAPKAARAIFQYLREIIQQDDPAG